MLLKDKQTGKQTNKRYRKHTLLGIGYKIKLKEKKK